VLGRTMPRVRDGSYAALPPSPETQGHQTLAQAKVWAAELARAIQGVEP